MKKVLNFCFLLTVVLGADWDDFRLPDTLQPIRYEIDLKERFWLPVQKFKMFTKNYQPSFFCYFGIFLPTKIFNNFRGINFQIICSNANFDIKTTILLIIQRVGSFARTWVYIINCPKTKIKPLNKRKNPFYTKIKLFLHTNKIIFTQR